MVGMFKGCSLADISRLGKAGEVSSGDDQDGMIYRLSYNVGPVTPGAFFIHCTFSDIFLIFP